MLVQRSSLLLIAVGAIWTAPASTELTGCLVPWVRNGRILQGNNSIAPGLFLGYRTRISVDCYSPYVLNINTTNGFFCLEDGRWFPYLKGNVKCMSECGIAPFIANGHVDINPSLTVVSCDAGYEFSGSDATIECQKSLKQWSPILGSCQPIDETSAPSLGLLRPRETSVPRAYSESATSRQRQLIQDQQQLYAAVATDNVPLARKLLNKGTLNVNWRDDNTYTYENVNETFKIQYGGALHVALLRNCSFAMATLLVSYGADVNMKEVLFQMTPLHIAAEFCNSEIVTLLVNEGSDVNAQQTNNVTPLGWAALHCPFEVVDFLLDRGSDPNAKNNQGTTPLMSAIWSGNYQVVRLLLDRGSNGGDKDANGLTSLMVAAHFGYAHIVALLLDRGIGFDDVDNFGWTALFYAAKNGNLNVVRLLLDRGNSIDHRSIAAGTNCNSCTALMIAAKFHHPDVVQFLVRRGANQGGCDNSNPTLNMLCP